MDGKDTGKGAAAAAAGADPSSSSAMIRASKGVMVQKVYESLVTVARTDFAKDQSDPNVFANSEASVSTTVMRLRLRGWGGGSVGG